MDYAQLIAEEARLIELINEPWNSDEQEAQLIDQLNDVQARIFDLQEDCVRSFGHTIGSLLAA